MTISELARELYRDPLKLRRHEIARRVRASWSRAGKRKVRRLLRGAQDLLDHGYSSAALVRAVTGFEVLMQSVLGPGFKALTSPLDDLAQRLVDEFFNGNAKAERFKKLVPSLLEIDFPVLDAEAWKHVTAAVNKRNQIVHRGDDVGRRGARQAIRAVTALADRFDEEIRRMAPDSSTMRTEMLLKLILGETLNEKADRLHPEPRG